MEINPAEPMIGQYYKVIILDRHSKNLSKIRESKKNGYITGNLQFWRDFCKTLKISQYVVERFLYGIS